ncbi:MAG TPA: hypothetical protein VHR47_13445 [Bacillota bacterium]|nr:hypothetical protein [Bacillota bacterium]
MPIPTTQPHAIYVSRVATNPTGPHWLNGSAFRIPVVVTNPYIDWPDLNWQGNDIIPQFSEGGPQYLWAEPMADPTHTTNFKFARRWDVTGTTFTHRTIPTGTYDFVVTHAADDRYTMILRLGNQALIPVGVNNGTIPVHRPWRNVKAYVYEDISLFPNSVLRLETSATNIGQPTGTFTSNPAMFSWVMQVFRDI